MSIGRSRISGGAEGRDAGAAHPIQIVWPTTYDNDAVVKRKLAEFSTRKVQDEATRAWNFFCALYYKAGGTPWRTIRDQREFSATFMGVSFFEGLDGSSL